MIAIVGAGGHGQVIADILRAGAPDGAVTGIVFVDDDGSRHGRVVLGMAVVGGIAELPSLAVDGAILAVGDNRTRRRLAERLAADVRQWLVARHARAIVAADVQVGGGTAICAGAVVNTGTRIGAHVIVNTAATIDHHTVVGDYVHIGPGVHMGGEVEIGDGALVGIGATVLPRVRIGAWSIVGAGAVVTDDVPPGATVVGVPARVIRAAATA